MRILHTADWHIGRGLAGFDLLDVQQRSFEKLRQVAKDEQVDAMIIAGDVYDRALASATTVKAVNNMLKTLNLEDQLPLLVVSGNHDSPARLATGRDWFKSTNLHLNTQIEESLTPVVLGDTQFFLLPYFDPIDAMHAFDDDSLTTLESAMRVVVAEMQQQFDPQMHHVLVAHFFAAGSTHSGSETKVTVGGLDAAPLDLLNAFDYVALGHLHNHDAVHADKIQYAGSLLKYDVSEANQHKGCYILDTDTMTRKFVPIVQKPDFVHVTDSFANIMNGPEPLTDPDNFVQFTLTDTDVIPDLMNRLRSRYPHTVGIERATHVDVDENIRQFDKNLDPMELLNQFYSDTLGREMNPDEHTWAQKTLNAVVKED